VFVRPYGSELAGGSVHWWLSARYIYWCAFPAVLPRMGLHHVASVHSLSEATHLLSTPLHSLIWPGAGSDGSVHGASAVAAACFAFLSRCPAEEQPVFLLSLGASPAASTLPLAQPQCHALHELDTLVARKAPLLVVYLDPGTSMTAPAWPLRFVLCSCCAFCCGSWLCCAAHAFAVWKCCGAACVQAYRIVCVVVVRFSDHVKPTHTGVLCRAGM